MSLSPEVQDSLSRDHEVVQDSLRQAATLRFSDFTVTPESVRDWYYAVDPVFEEPNELFVRMHIETNFEKQREYFLRRQQYAVDQVHTEEIAALTLLAGVVRPELPHDPSWVSILQLEAGMAGQNKNPDTQVASELLAHIPDTLDAVQATDLYMALDLLNSATAFSGDILDLHTMLGPRDAEMLQLMIRLRDKIADYTDLVFGFAERLSEIGLSSSDPTVRKVGLRAGLFLHASQLERAKNWRDKVDTSESDKLFYKTVRDYFTGYLDLIERYFLTDVPDGLKSFRGEKKGDLHEVLYTLDLNFIFVTDPERYDTWVATPAFLRFDEPRHGGPAYKRNCDTIIRSPKRVATAQLKSGNYGKDSPDTKPSHPNIWFLREANFEDAGLRRLGAKIHRYRRWLEVGDEATTQAVHRGVLPSVIETLPKVDEMNLMTDSAYQISRMPHLQLDRAARRRLARIYGELSERKRNRRE